MSRLLETVSSLTTTTFLRTTTLSNTVDTFGSGDLSVFYSGDVGLDSGKKLLFNNSLGTGNLPSPSTRSSGSCIVIKPGLTSGFFIDMALGYQSDSFWFSTPGSFKFYTDSLLVSIESAGLVVETGTVQPTILDTFSTTNFALKCVGSTFLSDACFFKFTTTTNTTPNSLSRANSTRLALGKRAGAGTFEAAIGYTTNTGELWLSAPVRFGLWCGTIKALELRTSGATILSSTTMTSNNTYTASDTQVALLALGDIGLASTKCLYLLPTPATPTGATRSTGQAIHLGGTNYLGTSNTGLYQVSDTSVKTYAGTTLVQEVGTVTTLLDTTGTSLVPVNPNSGDIIGSKTFTTSTDPSLGPIAITGLAFDPTKTRYFKATLSFNILLTNATRKYLIYIFDALTRDGTTYDITNETELFDRDDGIKLLFTATGGQINVASEVDITNYSTMTVKFNAMTLPV